MKNIITIVGISSTLFLMQTLSFAQKVTEQTQDLPKAAAKGYFYGAELNSESGNIEVTYQLKGKKKDELINYQTFIFDQDAKFLSNNENKPSVPNGKEDYTREVITAQLGNGRGMSVMSLKLFVNKSTLTYKWNKRKQKYYYSVTSQEQVKLKNDDEKTYTGYAAYSNYQNGEMMLLGMSLNDGKRRQISILNIKPDLSVKDIPLDVKDGMQSLAFADLISKDHTKQNVDDLDDADMVFVFSPKYDKKVKVDFNKYTYMRIDNTGKVKERIDLDLPSPNLVINGIHQDNKGAVYLVGSYSSKDDEPFEKRYGECVYINNPVMESGAPNVRMENYEKKLIKENKDVFATIKIENGAVVSIVSNDIKSLKSLAKSPSGQKKAKPYDGGMFLIQNFDGLPNGGFLITGQKIAYTKPKGTKYAMRAYKDLVCIQLDNTGKVVAQYCISPQTIKSKENTIFPILQKLNIAQDGQTAYLQLLENKSSKQKDNGGFMGGVAGNSAAISYSSNYYPSVVKLNIANQTISDYTLLGKRKFEVWNSCPYLWDSKNNALIYVGSDGDKLWIGKYEMM
ncbi:MAG TPA: hypothetical protein VLZ83_03325 [Edaphocola sp.]|nr:hypothetical protein [Edaphocola sp.]